jgi:peptidoglycan/LPS O-acetylase OafA/YrhL
VKKAIAGVALSVTSTLIAAGLWAVIRTPIQHQIRQVETPPAQAVATVPEQPALTPIPAPPQPTLAPPPPVPN